MLTTIHKNLRDYSKEEIEKLVSLARHMGFFTFADELLYSYNHK